MSKPDFRNMSAEEFKAFRPRTDEEEAARNAEGEFREWCEENGEDPQDESAHDTYKEILEETGDKFWDNLDENDRAGWEDNMNKD